MSDSDGGAQRQNSRAGLERAEKAEASEAAKREAWERQKHQAELNAINALTDELKAQRQEANCSEQQKARREKTTIILVVLTLLATAYGDYVFHQTMKDARVAVAKAHQDSVDALDSAHWAAQNALIGSHIDSFNALKAADASGLVQHQDTLGALARADTANRISRDTEARETRAYLIATPGALTVPSAGGKLKTVITIENLGRTPARRETWVSGFGFTPDFRDMFSMYKPKSCAAIFKDRDAHSQLVGRQVSVPKESESILTPQNVDSINTGLSTVYFVGRICYEDILKRPHFTDFCLFWMKDGASFVPGYCERGNDIN